jgi:hypothetical protein
MGVKLLQTHIASNSGTCTFTHEKKHQVEQQETNQVQQQILLVHVKRSCLYSVA